MSITAKVVAHSLAHNGVDIVTLELQYPRFIHSEVMTHRVFSRNAMSSRAIPVAKMIEQVRTNPAMPVYWGANQAGMQAAAELDNIARLQAIQTWKDAACSAAHMAEKFAMIGLHKQVANRVLEPFQWMRTIVTATEWTNFFELRAHPDAQPEFQALAVAMQEATAKSQPVKRPLPDHWNRDSEVCWHLPYVTDEERRLVSVDLLPKISAARCARVSYLTHDGENPDIVKDLQLFERLVGSKPLHASPIEHQATPLESPFGTSRNFTGWRQFRETYEHNRRS